MAIGELFGRRIRVTVGDQIVCDLDPFEDRTTNEGRNLHVEFETEKHTKLDPLSTSITVWNLTRDERDKLSAELDASNQVAWKKRREIQAGRVDIVEGAEQAALSSLRVNGARVSIEAGYGSDLGFLNVAHILPGGLKHSRESGGGWKTEIKAQDTRFLWQNAFVNQTVAGGVSLYDYQAVIDASEAVASGEDALATFTAAFPELTQIKDIPGHKNGFVLHGQAQRNRRQLSEVLGLRPFLNEFGQLLYLDPQATIKGPAVKLAPSTGLLNATRKDRGFYTAVSLLNYRLGPGRQVQLYEEILDPIALEYFEVFRGVFRVDYAKHTGSDRGTNFTTECELRPTGLKSSANA